ncbi:hypothetical protein C8Q70DRAFT_62413 [Cubamyces menziesii]|nr:hypothetical protein C8Q70DRAFT_62413 [Cubamyces menziesii]
MITREQIFRVVQTVAVPLLLAFVVRQLFGDPREEAPRSFYQPLLADIGFVPRKLTPTYRTDVEELIQYERVSALQNATRAPDTTAVILNWSRFPNVLLITSLLCAPWLDDTIAQVFIWNNHPKKLRYEDMKNTGCPRSKLRIHNAPANLLFQARYLACAQAETPYCFIQDDDYLVRSEIIQSLRARMGDDGAARAVHLLPPHEHLSTALREVHIKTPDDARISDIHVSFAWLGYGTMLRRSEAQQFLSLMRYLKVADEEMKMADNYFTILSNRVPEVWFDQGFELGGGQPFTAGSEGDERNQRYILRAAQYLDALTHCGRASCNALDTYAEQARPSVPYVTLDRSHAPTERARAVCRGSACVLETNIRLLPDGVSHTAEHVGELLDLERRNAAAVGESGRHNYIQQPLSQAVDSKADTVFRSFAHATVGDMLSLDLLTDIGDAREWTAIELVWLVDSATEDILKACAFEWSSDGVTWQNPASHGPICYDTSRDAVVDDEKVPLRECSAQMLLGSSALHLRATGRYFRARLNEDKQARWVVAEVWLRGL